MGLGGIFKKIGKGVWAGLRRVDDVGDFIDRLPGGKNLLLMIPVYGPIAKMALDEINWADQVLPGSGSGKEKLEMAVERLLERLKHEGVDDVEAKEAETLIENMLLAKKGAAGLEAFGAGERED